MNNCENCKYFKETCINPQSEHFGENTSAGCRCYREIKIMQKKVVEPTEEIEHIDISDMVDVSSENIEKSLNRIKSIKGMINKPQVDVKYMRRTFTRTQLLQSEYSMYAVSEERLRIKNKCIDIYVIQPTKNKGDIVTIRWRRKDERNMVISK